MFLIEELKRLTEKKVKQGSLHLLDNSTVVIYTTICQNEKYCLLSKHKCRDFNFFLINESSQEIVSHVSVCRIITWSKMLNK